MKYQGYIYGAIGLIALSDITNGLSVVLSSVSQLMPFIF